VATFKLIVAYAMRLISGDVSTHKVLMLDEVHAFSDTADGQRFLSRVLRMARSMNVTVILLTQLLGDLERLKDLIGVVMAFRQQSVDQAKANLRMMGLDENNQDLIERLLGFENGMCLMRGLDGRVVQMQVDPADPDFLRLADTNPARPHERQEVV
jgi:DNA helicase HerA-like ATPase